MGVTIYIVGLIINILIDGLLWGNEQYISRKGHFVRFCLRAGFCVSLTFGFYYYPQLGGHAGLLTLPYLWTMAAAWWFLFDMGVNLVAGQKLFHLGRTSLFDSFFWWVTGNRYKPAIILQYSVKIIALALGLYLISPSGSEWFEIQARWFYLNQIW